MTSSGGPTFNSNYIEFYFILTGQGNLSGSTTVNGSENDTDFFFILFFLKVIYGGYNAAELFAFPEQIAPIIILYISQ